MAITLDIPFLSYEKIGEIAHQLLCKYKYHLTIPIPIEYLIEFDLGINICLIDGLLDSLEVEGWTTSDATTIQLDTDIYKHREQKARCILGHELGHVILHKDIFEAYQFRTTEEWKKFCLSVTEKSYAWLESQAQNFAGLLLVPKMHLEVQFKNLLNKNEGKFEKARKLDIPKDAYEDYFIDFVSTELAETFSVTKAKIVRRLEKSGLKKLIP